MANYQYVLKTEDLNVWDIGKETIDENNIYTEGLTTYESAVELALNLSKENPLHFFVIVDHFDVHELEQNLLQTAFINGNEIIPRAVYDETLEQLAESDANDNQFVSWVEHIVEDHLEWSEQDIFTASPLEMMQAVVDHITDVNRVRFANDVLIYQVLDDCVRLIGMNHIDDIRLPDNSNATWLTSKEMWSDKLNTALEIGMSYGKTRDDMANMLRDVTVAAHADYNVPLRATPIIVGFTGNDTVLIEFVKFFPSLQNEEGSVQFSLALGVFSKKIKKYLEDTLALTPLSKSGSDLRLFSGDKRPLLSVKINTNAKTLEGCIASLTEWEIAE